MIYLRARYYDPATGRFLTQDPFPGITNQPASLHPYQYAANNPILYTDPSGEFVLTLGTLLLLGLGGGFLGGLGYYGLQHLTNNDPCAEWNWKEAALWSGAGIIIGGTLAVGTYGVGWGLTQLGIWGTGATGAAGSGLTAACADDGCAGEVRAATTAANQVSQAVQRGLSAVRSGIGRSYNSYDAFTYHEGKAGAGYNWHHIVEQRAGNVARFGNRMIQNTNNTIRLPSGGGLLHNRISGYYSSIQPLVTGSNTMRVRDWLSTKSFEFQWQFGIDVIIRFGGEQYIIDRFGGY